MSNNKSIIIKDNSRYIKLKTDAFKLLDFFTKLNYSDKSKALTELKKFYPDEAEYDTVRLSLVLPDTEIMKNIHRGNLDSMINRLDNGFIEPDDGIKKMIEYYGSYKGKELLDNGIIPMAKDSFDAFKQDENEYILAKQKISKYAQQFFDLPLAEKKDFKSWAMNNIQDFDQFTPYKRNVILAGLFIPNDEELMANLDKNNGSMEEASYIYKVPEAVIEFKKNEYTTRDTLNLLNDKKIQAAKCSKSYWFTDELGSPFVDKGPYIQTEISHIMDIKENLEEAFSPDINKTQSNNLHF